MHCGAFLCNCRIESTDLIQTLQAVMGHSDLKVSLTYLRGLDVKQLDLQDMPSL